MKTIVTVIAVCFISAFVNAQEFKFDEEIINYGKITEGSEGTRVFEFTNIGNAPLIIKEIKSSCGCAVPKKPEQPIMPGKKGSIEVSYNTKRVGGFSKAFTIFSNAKTERKSLRIKGQVVKSNS